MARRKDPPKGIAGIVALSADIADTRVLRVHFNHDITDKDRAELLAAVNLFNLGSDRGLSKD